MTFDLPGFNGTVRLAAVAWSRDKVGAAQADVTVRDAVVVSATLPRFLDVGDRSQMHVDIDNVDGEAGDYTLDLDLHGPLTADADALRQTLHLDAHQRRAAAIPIAAAGIGAADFDLRLTGPATDQAQHFTLGIVSGAPDVYRRTVTPLPSGASATVSGDLLADFIPGTGSIAVAASPFGALDAPALLQALDRYPYGCSEQTVSRAMPLLYANRLASLENLGVDPDLGARVKQAIEREMSRQSASGAFGLWARRQRRRRPLARRLRHRLPDPRPRAEIRGRRGGLRPGARSLAQHRRQRARAERGQQRRARLCALRAGAQRPAGDRRPALSDRRQARRVRDAARQGSARRGAGDARRPRPRRQGLFRRACRARGREGRWRYPGPITARACATPPRCWRSSPRPIRRPATCPPTPSPARAPRSTRRARTAPTPARRRTAGWCWPPRGSPNMEASATFAVDGQPVKGALNRRFGPDALSGKSATIANTGQATAQLVTTVSGSPIAPEPAASNGYTVERTIYSLDGKTIDPKSLAQNQRVVVALKVTEAEARACAAPDRRPSAGRARDRQSGARRRRLGRGLLVADERRDAGACRISRRPVRRGVRPRAGAVGLHRSRLCRARRRARPLRLAAGDGGSHVRPRTLRPHRLRRDGGDGEVSKRGPMAAFATSPRRRGRFRRAGAAPRQRVSLKRRRRCGLWPPPRLRPTPRP